MAGRQAEVPLLRRLVGEALRRRRLAQGRTLRNVADAARVSMPYLSEVERGLKEASSEVLAAICRALHVRLADLLDEVRLELARVEPQPAAPLRAVAAAHAIAGEPGDAHVIVSTVTARATPTARIGFTASVGPVASEDRAAPVAGSTAPFISLTSAVGSVDVGGRAGMWVRLSGPTDAIAPIDATGVSPNLGSSAHFAGTLGTGRIVVPAGARADSHPAARRTAVRRASRPASRRGPSAPRCHARARLDTSAAA
ncbi:helix-turn-helix transcriptional regulator [Frankia sp. AgKG'84/4]|uniref:helix-turn-helix domain-containing protein n=1 Tax=Frankia sp. AgKG'84/4 TaxID=573490 RepID=UPI0025434AEA